jgi:hypothetical protein
VQVLEGGSSEAGLYIVTELVRRPTLAEVLESDSTDFQRGRLKAKRMLKVLGPVAEVLDAANARGVVHGCLQTRSIKLGPREEAWVDDFGLSSLGTGAGSSVGSVLFHGAPEQFDGDPATAASDVYALAAVAYECLTGLPPYWQGALSHDGSPPPSVARETPGLPSALDVPLRRALSRHPGARQTSAGELMDELTEIIGPQRRKEAPSRKRATGERRPVAVRAPADAARPRTRRTQARLALGAAVLAAIAGAAGYFLNRDEPSPPGRAPTTVRSGPVGLTVPTGWKRSSPGDVAGMGFTRRPIALADTTEPAGSLLLAGPVAATAPTFVPTSLSASLVGPLPKPDVVDLRGLRTLRYSGVRRRGAAGETTLYAAPTSGGVALISCGAMVTGTAAARFLTRCEDLAATLELQGAQPVELLFSAEYGRVLTTVLDRLNAARDRVRPELEDRATQPAAARSLSLAYAEAGEVLARTEPPPAAEVHNSIRRAFRRTRQAYAELSRAGRQPDQGAYRRARRDVAEGERDIEASLRDLDALGYTAGG